MKNKTRKVDFFKRYVIISFATFISGLRLMPEVWENEVNRMKKDIHPKYHECTVTCACGETFKTGSVRENLKIEICSQCHPFFTGKQKLVDTGGRVDRFNKRYGIK